MAALKLICLASFFASFVLTPSAQGELDYHATLTSAAAVPPNTSNRSSDGEFTLTGSQLRGWVGVSYNDFNYWQIEGVSIYRSSRARWLV